MSQELDFNVSPYFDDYNEDKNFHRILFKPSQAVQARELTQLQTILQKQIERFGDHVFKNGSRVLGGKFDPQDPVDYVRIQTNIGELPNLIGAELVGTVTGLRAKVIHAEADPTEIGVTVLFINYTDSNNSEIVTEFTNETINYTTTTSITGSMPTSALNTAGTGSIFGISEGVLYVRGFFVKFDSQKIAIDPFNASANKKVYFKATFSTVDSNADTSLLDNAQGFNNFNAPGADRLRCELTLNVSDLDVDLEDDNNFLLLELRNGEVFEKNEKTLYNQVAEELARRTYNESGDYIVRGWTMNTREHLNTGTNGGKYTEAEGGDSSKYVVELEKGLAYVKGYEVETVATRAIEGDKATDFTFVNENYSFVPSGPHVIVNEIMGIPDPDNYVEVTLYDLAEARITNEVIHSATPNGNAIGTARLVSYLRKDGKLGSPDATMRFYIADVSINSGKSFADVRGIGNSTFFADIVLEDGQATIYDTTNNPRLIYAGSDYVRSIKNESNNDELNTTFIKQGSGSITTGGSITGIVSLSSGESLIYAAGTLGSLAKDTLLLTVTQNGYIDGDGSVSVTNGSKIVTGVGSNFNKLNVGDRIKISGNLYIIESIESNTSLTLTEAALGTASGQNWTKEYVAGDIIDLNSKGYTTGVVRTVTATSSTLSINLGETLSSTVSCKLSYRVVKTSAGEIEKTIKAKHYVKIDGSTASDLSNFYLGVSDAFVLRSVRKDTSEITSSTQGTDVTSQFILVPNITGYSYNTSYIQSNAPISNTEHLLIEFDYFDPDISGGGSYFSVDSYPIDDTTESDTTVKTEDLDFIRRNHIDFRAVKAPTATPGTSIATAPTNPTNSTTFSAPVSGLSAPTPGTNLVFDYSYYTARRDVLAVSPKGEFKIFKGRSSLYPNFPRVPETYMGIANIFVTPYPSLSNSYAKVLGKLDEAITTDVVGHKRHTMADISAMKTRIQNLEFYTSLNLLEKDTLDLTIPDENGLDRFKNGVFVNSFVDHSLSDLGDLDFNIAVDKVSKVMQPAVTVEGFDTNFTTGSGTTRTGALIHIPFTETVMKEQLFATSTRNIELSSYRYVGDMNVYPDIDTWADISTVDKSFDIGNDTTLGDGATVSTEVGAWGTKQVLSSTSRSRVINTQTGAWKNTQTGAISGTSSNVFKVYHRDFGDRAFNGNEKLLKTFNTLSEVMSYINVTSSKRSSILNAYQAAGNTLTADIRTQLDRATRGGRFFIIQPGSVQTSSTSTRNIDETVSTTTTERVIEERSLVDTIINVDTDTNDIGSFVTDVSVIPYIRPQSIRVYAFGLKPNTRFHIFFDGENMNDYVSPVSVDQYFDSVKAAQDDDDGYENYDMNLSNIGQEGSEVYSNAKGEVLAFLRLPSDNNKRFRVGEKEITVTDSSTNSVDASSYSKGTFVASGLNVQKQNTILSTRTLSTETRERTENRTVTRTSSRTSTTTETQTRTNIQPAGWFEVGPSCAAYSFLVEEGEGVEGVFMTSVDIWLSALHPTLGVWFEIREMDSAGGITRTTVPHSVVWMNRDDERLKVSTDGITNSTKVNFKSPVFLYNDTQYAFVIHTEGLNPDSYFWISRLGENDIATGNQVSNRGQFGTFYTTNNNLNWDIVPDIDLKIRFNRAQFNASVDSPATGTATYLLEDAEFFSSNTDFNTTFFESGEPVRGTEILNIALTNGATLQVGDTIVDGTSSANATILEIDGTDIYTDGFDFIINSNTTIYEANTAVVRDTGTISSVDFGIGVVDIVDRVNKKFDVIHSNGKFYVDGKIRSVLPNRHKSVLNGTDISVTYSGATSTVPNPYAPTGTITLPRGLAIADPTVVPGFTIERFDTYDFNTATLRPSYLNASNETNVTFSTIATEGTTLKSAIEVDFNEEHEYEKVHNVLSRSEEVRLLNGEKSFKINMTFSSTSPYLTPVVDSAIAGVVFSLNEINNDDTNENLPSGGNLEAKYISKVIQLSDENKAEDLILLLQEYRPASTQVKVWARFRNNADIRDISTLPWIELSTSKTAVSSSTNKENFIDTTYEIPVEYLTGGDVDAFQYTESGELAVISGSEMIANTDYFIVSAGSTDFTDYGAANNDVGTAFTATGPSDGDGTVSANEEIIYTRFNEFQIKIGLLASNRAVYPKISSLRAIALQR